jgi:anti-sigma factor RsiW
MEGRKDNNQTPLGCGDCRSELQEYLDGTLEKTRSLAVFLHLRGCPSCQAEHDAMQALFGLLESLPAEPAPEGFDEPILAAVPLAAYRAMEPLRRDRVPVFLTEEALPGFVRAPATRVGGLVLAAAAATAVGLADAPPVLLLATAAGALPELLVRVQGLARRATLALRRAEG